jgi:hypothetical protein
VSLWQAWSDNRGRTKPRHVEPSLDDEPPDRPARKRPPEASSSKQNLPTIGAAHCWCGQPSGHDWPGRDTGHPHPRADQS